MNEKSVKRWSAKRKQEVVLRLLRGESLDALSRETGQPASVLSQWRDEFLECGIAALKRHTDDPRWRPWSGSSSAPSPWSES